MFIITFYFYYVIRIYINVIHYIYYIYKGNTIYSHLISKIARLPILKRTLFILI